MLNVILTILLVLTVIQMLMNLAAYKALGIYIKKKGYTLPTDVEITECSREALKELFTHRK